MKVKVYYAACNGKQETDIPLHDVTFNLQVKVPFVKRILWLETEQQLNLVEEKYIFDDVSLLR